MSDKKKDIKLDRQQRKEATKVYKGILKAWKGKK